MISRPYLNHSGYYQISNMFIWGESIVVSDESSSDRRDG